jgi:hypothetical protein
MELFFGERWQNFLLGSRFCFSDLAPHTSPDSAMDSTAWPWRPGQTFAAFLLTRSCAPPPCAPAPGAAGAAAPARGLPLREVERVQVEALKIDGVKRLASTRTW